MTLVASPAQAEQTSENVRIPASDGVELAVTVSGEAPLSARPTVVEFSPYGRSSQSYTPPADYNLALVQIRGTGDSDGRFDALGPRTQQDVSEVLGWACGQPWSDGNLAVNGFSASAITIYNSLHLPLPCLKAMLLKSGTFELYRDLLVPGGINNTGPGLGVLALIGAPALRQGGDRLQRKPESSLDIISGMFQAGLDEISHPSLDDWWRERGFRGDVNHIPALIVDGFFDVESRGAFEGFGALKNDGAHLLVLAGHDGAPAGTDGGYSEQTAWLDHYLRGADNGVDGEDRVQVTYADGDREDFTGGKWLTTAGDDWPLPGTDWQPLELDATRSGSALSANDGSLSLTRANASTPQSYLSLPSLFTATDVPTTALLGASGLNQLTNAVPILSETTIAGALGLTYSTQKLTQDVTAIGPASLELKLSSTAPETGIWAVISDVDEDGTPHPLTVGRLNTAYPGVDAAKSRTDSEGDIVQPYGDYSTRNPTATPGVTRDYKVEFWPIGNRFRAGHRIRLDIVGQSLLSQPGLPALNTLEVGGPDGARLLFPQAPGSDLAAALGSTAAP